MKTNNFFFNIICLLLLILVASCEDPKLYVHKSEDFAVDAQGVVKGSINVRTEHTDWSVEVISGKDWLKASYNGDNVSFDVEENTDKSPRTGTIKITATEESKLYEIVDIVQEGAIAVNGRISTDLNFGYKKDETQYVAITATKEWHIGDVPSWLRVSPTTGTGNSQIAITVTKDNLSSQRQTASINVVSASSTATINIIQEAAYESGCDVSVSNVVALCDAAAYQVVVDRKVKYYTSIIMNSTMLSRFTDNELIEYLKTEDRDTPEDEIFLTYVTGLNPSETYTICSLGFDSQGNHGELTKTKITTPSDRSVPMAIIDNVKYDENHWYWSTTKSAYCYDYYQWQLDNMYMLDDVIVAWYFNRYIADGHADIVVNDGSWNSNRRGSNIFDHVTWGRDRNGKFGGMIDRFTGSVNSAKAMVVSKAKSKKTECSLHTLPIMSRDEFKKNITIISK